MLLRNLLVIFSILSISYVTFCESKHCSNCKRLCNCLQGPVNNIQRLPGKLKDSIKRHLGPCRRVHDNTRAGDVIGFLECVQQEYSSKNKTEEGMFQSCKICLAYEVQGSRCRFRLQTHHLLNHCSCDHPDLMLVDRPNMICECLDEEMDKLMLRNNYRKKRDLNSHIQDLLDCTYERVVEIDAFLKLLYESKTAVSLMINNLRGDVSRCFSHRDFGCVPERRMIEVCFAKNGVKDWTVRRQLWNLVGRF